MPYYKIKVRSFASGREIYISLEATCFQQALCKTQQYCAYTKNLYHELEDFLEEITEEEYAAYMSKTSSK